MTTTVIIKSTEPNHENVKVEVVDPKTGKKSGNHTILTDGEEVMMYVHSGSALHIKEVAKNSG